MVEHVTVGRTVLTWPVGSLTNTTTRDTLMIVRSTGLPTAGRREWGWRAH